MQINLIRIIFLLATCFIGSIGLLLKSYLPKSVTDICRYGKVSNKNCHPFFIKTAVPKTWFKHFYIFAAPASSYVLYLAFYKYLWNGDIPKIIIWMLDMCFGSNRQPLVSPESTFVAALLFNIHLWKRFYESHYINILSGEMNVAHYIMAYYHYFGTVISVIGESKGFIEGSESRFLWENITYMHLICAFIAILSSYVQLRANYTLSGLRKDKNGEVVSTAYKIPYGGLFEYVSGALQITEIMVYSSICVILWESSTYRYITIWVFVNQLCTAVLTHKWYLKTFQNYPKSRKILLPYIF